MKKVSFSSATSCTSSTLGRRWEASRDCYSCPRLPNTDPCQHLGIAFLQHLVMKDLVTGKVPAESCLRVARNLVCSRRGIKQGFFLAVSEFVTEELSRKDTCTSSRSDFRVNADNRGLRAVGCKLQGT